MRVVDPARSSFSTWPRIVPTSCPSTRLVQQATVGSPPQEGSTHHQFFAAATCPHCWETPQPSPLGWSRCQPGGPYRAHCSKAHPISPTPIQPGSAYQALMGHIPPRRSHSPFHKKRPPHIGELRACSHLRFGGPIRTPRAKGVLSLIRTPSPTCCCPTRTRVTMLPQAVPRSIQSLPDSVRRPASPWILTIRGRRRIVCLSRHKNSWNNFSAS